MTSRAFLEGNSDHLDTVAFSAYGKLLTSAPSDRTPRLRDLMTVTSCGTLEEHVDWVKTIVFPSKGKLLASITQEDVGFLIREIIGGDGHASCA